MNRAIRASLLIVTCTTICGNSAYGQSILNQNKDDLLKDFDIGKGLSAPGLPAQNSSPTPTWAPGSQPGTGAANAGSNIPSTLAAPGSPALQGSTVTPGYQLPAALMNGPQKGLVQRLIEGAMNAVNVSHDQTNGTHVKVPFVNVDVGGQGPGGLQIKAPFVKYDSGTGPQIKAPFVKFNCAQPAANSVPAASTFPIAPTAVSGASNGAMNGTAPGNQCQPPEQGSSLR